MYQPSRCYRAEDGLYFVAGLNPSTDIPALETLVALRERLLPLLPAPTIYAAEGGGASIGACGGEIAVESRRRVRVRVLVLHRREATTRVLSEVDQARIVALVERIFGESEHLACELAGLLRLRCRHPCPRASAPARQQTASVSPRADVPMHHRATTPTHHLSRHGHSGTITTHEVWPPTDTAGAQFAQFRDHDVVISPHGAALVNAIFMRPGTHLIELWPEVSRGFLRKEPPQTREQGEEQRGSGGEREYEYLTTTLGVRYTAAVVDGSWGSKELGVDDGTLLAVEKALREWSTELAREIERGAWW